MDREEKVLQEYILYVQHKENFVNRSFEANRFYLIISLIVLAVTVPVALIPYQTGIVFTMLFALIGMVLCVMWFLNIKSYKNLLKIKFQNVIERLEDELPVKPYQMESQALKEESHKRGFVFADMQRALSIIIFITFLTILAIEIFLMITFIQ